MHGGISGCTALMLICIGSPVLLGLSLVILSSGDIWCWNWATSSNWHWTPCPAVLRRDAPFETATFSSSLALAAAVSGFVCLTVLRKLETTVRNGLIVLTGRFFRKEEQACIMLTDAARLLQELSVKQSGSQVQQVDGKRVCHLVSAANAPFSYSAACLLAIFFVNFARKPLLRSASELSDLLAGQSL